MKKIGKKFIIIMSVLTYLSTVQAMAMMMPAGLGSHCQESHHIAVDVQAEDSVHSKSSANQEQTHHESSHDNHHCMACFAIPDDEVNYLSNSQPSIDLHRVIQEFCSVALNTLSPPPKRRSS